jgi:hypothetical protein
MQLRPKYEGINSLCRISVQVSLYCRLQDRFEVNLRCSRKLQDVLLTGEIACVHTVLVEAILENHFAESFM